MEAEELIMSDRQDSERAYQQMTQREKDEYNALVARLDDMLTEKKNRERRLKAEVIDFKDRRTADRRKSQR